jgi:hypothetical protein
VEENKMTDERPRLPLTSADDVAPSLDEEPRTAARTPRKRRGVAGGRIAAAGIGIAAMVGLVANMEVANSKAAAEETPNSGPEAQLGALRWEKSARQGPAKQPGRIADAGKVRPIVLTPHTVVHTVGGGSSGGGSSASYSSGSSAPAAAAAPVASSSGSH